MRTFLNRPLAASANDAAALLKLARECKNPIFAASLLAVDPSVMAVREERKQFEPLKIVNVTGPTNHFWWYVPHAISALVSALGSGIEEVYVHDFEWDQEGVTFRNPLVVFFRYGKDAAIIGDVTASHPGRVILRTALGASRILDMPVGELLPRIC